jgi:hypothetical protein
MKTTEPLRVSSRSLAPPREAEVIAVQEYEIPIVVCTPS